MNKTINYFNNNAEQYYQTTVDADLDDARKRFISFLSPAAMVIDIGCGSGRDAKAFGDMGYSAIGLDASEELIQLAKERLGISAITADMSCWIADEPYDGIWCCASIMHLTDYECRRFFTNLNHNLKPCGVLYISVKTGIQTGEDEAGRYLRNFTEEEMWKLISMVPGLQIKELWYSEDTLKRNDFRWLNIVAIRK